MKMKMKMTVKDKLILLYKKYKELIHYIFFGGLTTVVNFIIYYGLIYAFDVHYIAAQIVAWIGAVIFAYITNKLFVYESKSREKQVLFIELLSFFAVRLFSFGVETLLLWLEVDIMGISESIAKIPAAVVTVILNYITGKFVFRKK